ncbi:hypothetical protein WR25_11964 [Diploscapter pachys]|uniref:Uncharacterized protein n=1 Tax=Diploscapter pachys TaxID=2018661 RepID=A0A2A2K7N5_9BILA|nr:hypothetical protein WR25_11964 [Diploscapter pachys]
MRRGGIRRPQQQHCRFAARHCDQTPHLGMWGVARPQRRNVDDDPVDGVGGQPVECLVQRRERSARVIGCGSTTRTPACA